MQYFSSTDWWFLWYFLVNYFLVKLTCYFFHMTNQWISLFFPPDWTTNLAFFLWLISEFHVSFHMIDWRISQISQHFFLDQLTNFAIFPCNQMTKFKIYFSWSIDMFCEFFLPQSEKEINQKGVSKRSVRATKHIRYLKRVAGCLM